MIEVSHQDWEMAVIEGQTQLGYQEWIAQQEKLRAVQVSSTVLRQQQIATEGLRIEKGIPLPSEKGKNKRIPLCKLLARMEVGDSMFIPGWSSNHAGAAGRNLRHRNKINYYFSARKVAGGCRMWRVK